MPMTLLKNNLKTVSVTAVSYFFIGTIFNLICYLFFEINQIKLSWIFLIWGLLGLIILMINLIVPRLKKYWFYSGVLLAVIFGISVFTGLIELITLINYSLFPFTHSIINGNYNDFSRTFILFVFSPLALMLIGGISNFLSEKILFFIEKRSNE